MADLLYEHQGLRFKAHDNADGTFAFATFDSGGAAGMADFHFEIQGHRVKAHDNGDGTFSPVTTTTIGAGDVVVEWQGVRFKLHPIAGDTVTIGGVVHQLFAIVVFPI